MIAYAFYGLLIIVPLILTPWNFELFEFNKMLTVYAFSLIIAGLWLVEMIRQKKIIFRRTPFDIPLLLFLASQILATIFSIDRHTSLWGYYSRFNGGLMSTLSYLVLFWAFATFMRDKVKQSLTVILTTGAIVSLYGIAEHLGIDKSIWVQDVQSRVFSTLGQPNWLAAYLLMLIPLAWERKSPWNYLYSLLFFITILFTKSRSGLLGLAVATGIYWILILLKTGVHQFPWKKLVLVGVSFSLAVLLFSRDLLPTLKQPQTGLAEETPTAAVNEGGSSSGDIRKVVWRGAIDIWKHYPVFGSGVETFAYSYYNFRPVEHNLLSEWDFLYNKAHNEFLNFLATTGAFGLGVYLLLIAWFTVYALKNDQPALLAGYLGLAVSNFFGFSVVPVAMLFFLWPAVALGEAKPALNQTKFSPVNNFQAAGITAVALITFFGLLFVAKMWRADFLFNLGRNQAKARLLTEGWQNLNRSVNLSPKEPTFRNDLAETEAQLAVAYSSPSAQLSQQFSDRAVKDSDLVISQGPVNLNFWRSRIKIFLLLSVVNPDYENKALEAFNRAIALAPTDPKLTYNLGLFYNQLGQSGLAEQLLVKTVDLKPDYEAARQNLGSLYAQTNRPELAKQEFEYIVKYLNPDNQAAKSWLKY